MPFLSNTRRVVSEALSPRRFVNAVMLSGTLMALVACGGGGGADSLLAASPDDGSAAIPSAGESQSMPRAALLTWDPVDHSNLAGYRVYYGIAPAQYDQARGQGINMGNVTTFTVTGLTSGMRYYFAVTSVDAMNNESGFSNEVAKDVL